MRITTSSLRCKKSRNHPFIKLCSSQIEYYEKYYKSWRIGGSGVIGGKAKGEKNKGRKRKKSHNGETNNELRRTRKKGITQSVDAGSMK